LLRFLFAEFIPSFHSGQALSEAKGSELKAHRHDKGSTPEVMARAVSEVEPRRSNLELNIVELGEGNMLDWNVVVTVREGRFVQACELLEELGPVVRTDYFNVLVMKVDGIDHLLETLSQWIAADPSILTILARVMPVTHTFDFQTVEEFEVHARQVVLSWVPHLAGKRFHVRMHRRGFKGRLSSIDEEKFLDILLLEALESAGTPGRISFEDPDVIIAVETVGNRAGLSLWTREDLQRYPFLHLD
jgi:tRNA(Ser,Leu) C12 N-acetylase TAN1